MIYGYFTVKWWHIRTLIRYSECWQCRDTILSLKIAFYSLFKARFNKETLLYYISSRPVMRMTFFSLQQNVTQEETFPVPKTSFFTSDWHLVYEAWKSQSSPGVCSVDQQPCRLWLQLCGFCKGSVNTHTGESSSPTCQTSTASLSQLLHTHSHGSISAWTTAIRRKCLAITVEQYTQQLSVHPTVAQYLNSNDGRGSGSLFQLGRAPQSCFSSARPLTC